MSEAPRVSSAIRGSYAVLFAVSSAGPAGTTVQDVCRTTGMHSRTVYRHVAALQELGLVEPAIQHGRFQIGAVTAGLAERTVDQREFLRVAQQITDEVTAQVSETVHTTVYDHGTAATVSTASQAVVRSAAVVPIVLGSRRPAHASASGKVFLAHSDSALRAYLMRPLESFTEHTLTDPARLIAACREIRDQRYALDLEENTLGITCVAVPVLGPSGHVAASLVISTASPAMPTDRKLTLLNALLPAADEFAHRIGVK